jgi:hemerythrin superfamily protein
MATRTKSNSSRSKSSRSNQGSRNGSSTSAFSWASDNAGPLIGAALAGAAIGIAANYGRKFVVQGMSAIAGDWDEVLATEHEMTPAIFDRMLATDPSQTWKRNMLLMQLQHALDKHAHQEEMVVYPALREANMETDAEHLNQEHLQVKTFLYELNEMEVDAPNWLEKVRQFRDLIRSHAHMEEEEVFPKFKQSLTEEQNDRITNLVNRDGFWQA